MLNLNKNDIDKKLNQQDGYVIFNILEEDLKIIRSMVQNHWKNKILEHYPDSKVFLNDKEIVSYHSFSNKFDHKIMWPMKNRILSKKDYQKFINTKLFLELKKIYNDAEITDENSIGYGEVYWRIVRPNQKFDVGPIHADRWFWEINNDFTPSNKRRIKCWISLWSKGNNGLRVVPNSQKEKYNFRYEFKDGENKPIFNPEEYNLKPINLDSDSGKAVIFHDSLLHGGAVNQAENTRISIEFTFFTNKIEN